MPYRSNAQRRFFHTDTAKRKGISASTVKEFDEASKGAKLPALASSSEGMKLPKRKHKAAKSIMQAVSKKVNNG